MVTYKKRRTSSAWALGVVIFILAMTITFADVYGLDRFDYRPPGNGFNGGVLGSDQETTGCYVNFSMSATPDNGASGLPTTFDPPSIPEPATLTLLLLGCGALLAGRRK